MWITYILNCGDGSYYTGVTNDLERRLSAHTDGSGARYTRGRGPFNVVYTEEFNDRSSAQVREAEIKRMKRSDKEKLINGDEEV